MPYFSGKAAFLTTENSYLSTRCLPFYTAGIIAVRDLPFTNSLQQCIVKTQVVYG